MMINNNPYNLPQRPPNKQNRVYAQSNTTQFRSAELTQNTTPYAQYIARQTGTNPKKNSINSLNAQQNLPSYRPPNYPTMRPEIVHYLPSPKNINSGPNSQHNIGTNYSFTNNNRAINHVSSSVDKKDLRESFGIVAPAATPAYDVKQLTQKIQTMQKSLKSTQKRLFQLQKSSNLTTFLPNNSKILAEEHLTNNSNLFNSNVETHQLLSRYQSQLSQNISKVMDEIHNVKDQMRNIKLNSKYGYNSEIQKTVLDKCREFFQMSKTIDSNNGYYNRSQGQEIKKQMQYMKINLEQRMKKNHDFLTSVIGRIQRQLHSSLSSTHPSYKPSPIKCSSTAILLRFVQCFKVRKHSTSTTVKAGEIKITLTDNTYYIDNQGYLLDKEQFYIVDSRDCRVRLDEKHIKLLRDQNILA